MGIKASATCELTLRRARRAGGGLLVGEVHDGIAQMFHVIEYARMGVGTKSMATLSTAYLNALDYAKDRKQGADLAQGDRQDRAARRDHPAPRRAPHADAAEGVRRGPARDDPVDREHPGPDRASRRGPGAEADDGSTAQRSAAAADQGLRLGEGVRAARRVAAVLRRLGLLQDYPIEQYIRDQKIDSLYEGTTPSRRSTCSSARSAAIAVRRCSTSSARSRNSSTATPPAPNSPTTGNCWLRRSRICRPWSPR